MKVVGGALAVLLVFGFGGGCGGGQNGGGSVVGAEENSWFECTADGDCVVVEMACCDHCNGGWVMSARKDKTDSVRARWGETCGGSIACTERACLAPPAPVCDQGTCARKEVRVDATGTESTVIVPNQPH